jgi:xanthine dehydrogenase YagT iron-sulfur-binding subunit
MEKKKEGKKEGKDKKGISRRAFLQFVGAGAVVSAGAGRAAAISPEAAEPNEKIRVSFLGNGRRRRMLVEPRWSLLFALREKMGLTGTKVGCERGECGACTVLINGQPRYSCLTLAVEAEGKEITTLEGLREGEELGPVQKAFVEHEAFQCGYCTPGQVMAGEGVLQSIPNPSPEEIRLGMSGNLCRCGFIRIFSGPFGGPPSSKGICEVDDEYGRVP